MIEHSSNMNNSKDSPLRQRTVGLLLLGQKHLELERLDGPHLAVQFSL